MEDYTEDNTFDQIKKLLYSIAYKYIKSCGGSRFHVDELVNEVWLKGRVQKSKNKKHLCMRIHWDIQEYIRDCISGKYKPEEQFKMKNPFSYDDELFDAPCKNDCFAEVDRKDWFEVMLKGCSSREKLIMKLYYLQNQPHSVAAKVIGVSETRISQIKKIILERLKRKCIGKDY